MLAFSTSMLVADDRARLQAALDAAVLENATLRARIQALEQQVETLTQQLVQAIAPRYKASRLVTTVEPPPRKQRTTNATRVREAATREVRHEPTRCPHCGRPLTGKATEHRRRQVIDLALTRYEVVDHLICSRHCGYCAQRVMAQPSAAAIGALPHYRVSLGLMAYVTNLVIAHRMPVAQVVSFLERAHGLHVAAGEVVEMLHRVADAGQDDLAQVLAEVQAADYAHADETGWRQNGRNGYLWQLRTLDACYLTFEFSRGSQVPRALLDDAFTGVLVSDFYSGYSPLGCRKQRCWVHFLRDLKALAEQHPAAADFVITVRALYEDAKALISQPGYAALPETERSQHRLAFERRAAALAAPHRQQPDDAARVLAERLDRFQTELFVFVECPALPAENNAAERTFRPLVIARKICGGTRSAKGSQTKATLFSLFVTWHLRGINPLQAIPRLLLGHSSLATAAECTSSKPRLTDNENRFPHP